MRQDESKPPERTPIYSLGRTAASSHGLASAPLHRNRANGYFKRRALEIGKRMIQGHLASEEDRASQFVAVCSNKWHVGMTQTATATVTLARALFTDRKLLSALQRC